MVLRNFHVGTPFNFLKINWENPTLKFLSVKCYAYTIITKARLRQFKESFMASWLKINCKFKKTYKSYKYYIRTRSTSKSFFWVVLSFAQYVFEIIATQKHFPAKNS